MNKNGIFNLAIALKESKMNDFVKVAYDKNNNQISGDLNKDTKLMDILLNRKDIENPKGDTESSLTMCNNANYGIAYLGAFKQHNVCYAMSI